MSHAVGSAFSDAVAHTSLVGAVILGAEPSLVAVLLPRRGKGDAQQEQASDGSEREPVSV